MPLPTGNLDWPPRELATITPQLDRWSAWYSGDTRDLERLYQPVTDRPSNRPSTYRGGVVGAVARTFWGAPRADLTQAKHKLHVPLAADLCQASADLLFSEPPTITADKTPVTDRLADLVDDGLVSTFAEAAELGAALGGTYLRVTWDKSLVSDRPFATAVDADGAWPEFRWGRLTAVTFWTVVRVTDTETWRHLERHELDNTGNGVILHGLYQGTRDKLGRIASLAEVESLAGLAPMLTDGNRVDTLTPGLAVTYIPNQRPQRLWRHDPLGRNLGRSDLDGVEGMMDALDETYTSWMRDIRLGKARVFASRSMLDNSQVQTLDDGTKLRMPATFDVDREVFSPLDMPPNIGAGGSGLPIQAEQFAIRYAEHDATGKALIAQILRTAGYSAQTFGEITEGAPDATATEVRARERRSYMTRDRKIRHWGPGLDAFLSKLLAVDAAVFNGPGADVAGLKITFGDAVQESPLALAQTAQALFTAQAASTEVRVALIHPDWPDEDVQKEAAKIVAETSMSTPDPFADPTVPPQQTSDAAGQLQQ